MNKPTNIEAHLPLLEILEDRFHKNMNRHPNQTWSDIETVLSANLAKLKSLQAMENSGGEPDLLCMPGDDRRLFIDCSPETPEGRRSLCYDEPALEARKKNKPVGSAIGLADEMGITLLDEKTYYLLQGIGEFDRKTSSWILTEASVRVLGGALFCDKRFDRVFTYHNGADSYYSSRGFRGALNLDD